MGFGHLISCFRGNYSYLIRFCYRCFMLRSTLFALVSFTDFSSYCWCRIATFAAFITIREEATLIMENLNPKTFIMLPLLIGNFFKDDQRRDHSLCLKTMNPSRLMSILFIAEVISKTSLRVIRLAHISDTFSNRAFKTIDKSSQGLVLMGVLGYSVIHSLGQLLAITPPKCISTCGGKTFYLHSIPQNRPQSNFMPFYLPTYIQP